MHAKLIIGGGPHMPTNDPAPGAGMCFASISSLMKPVEYGQSASPSLLLQLSVNP